MGLYLKITAGLLLLVLAFHVASLQDSTDSPVWTIDKDWLRELTENTAGSQNTAVPGEETEYDQRLDATGMESSNEFNSGIPSGSMAVYNNEEEENVAGQDNGENEASDNLTAVTTTAPLSVTPKQPELSDATVPPTTDAANSNMTQAEEESRNSTTTPSNATTHLSAKNTTGSSDLSNRNDLQTTTSAPESNGTQESTTKRDEDRGLTNSTESNNTLTTTTKQEIQEASTVSSSSSSSSSTTTTMITTTPTVFPSETTETSPATTTTAAPITTEKANETDKGAASGDNSERGVVTDNRRSRRNGAWVAILGTAVAVTCVGLVAYILLKKKHRKGFSHSKLVEEFPADPVLRLDNNEPLDLNFGRGSAAYYNPGLQGDNIQMSNFPGRH